MSHFFLCQLTSFILFCLTVHGADQRNREQQTISPEQVMADAERRLINLRERIDILEKILDKEGQSMHQQSDVVVPRDEAKYDDSDSEVEDPGQMIPINSVWSNWILRARQLRHLSFLRYKKRKFVASIFALRHGENRLFRELIDPVINQWTPLAPGMTMDQLIQCRDLRHESFLSRKCAQEIDHQLTVCNKNREERITLGSGFDQSTPLLKNRVVHQLHFVDRESKTNKLVVVDVPLILSKARYGQTWIKGFSCVQRLKAYAAGTTHFSRPSGGVVNLPFDFIQKADGSFTAKVGWNPDKIEMKDVKTWGLGTKFFE